MMVLDFFTETFSPLVANVTNKVYFQAWATDDRADVYEFSNASLKITKLDGTSQTLLESVISTEHRGKGSFSFVYEEAYQRVYLEIELKEPQGVTI
jgi:hypothetical protein